MRVVLDTNILVSSLMVQLGNPASIYRAWREGYFTLLTCEEQLDEVRTTLRKPALAERIKPYKAGRLVNDIWNSPKPSRHCRACNALPIRKQFRRPIRVNLLARRAQIERSRTTKRI